eukprot:GCRY01000123.1.p1 GENE.GCRY01000123.1~~GCRY01000123.1.p1  ORF type:complete len:1280 (-),score=414.11 GCRY01000123.1:277-4116(-)
MVESNENFTDDIRRFTFEEVKKALELIPSEIEKKDAYNNIMKNALVDENNKPQVMEYDEFVALAEKSDEVSSNLGEIRPATCLEDYEDPLDRMLNFKYKGQKPLTATRRQRNYIRASYAQINSENEVSMEINGQSVSCPENFTVLDACRKAGIFVPTLCDHPRLKASGKCGMCCVEIEGASDLRNSCVTKVKEGMVVKTDSPKARAGSLAALNKLKSLQTKKDPFDNPNMTEFESLQKWGVQNDINFSRSIVIDPRECIACERCVKACSAIQGMSCLTLDKDTGKVATKRGVAIDDTDCIACGQCTSFCPTGAITEKSDIDKVRAAMKGGKTVVVQTAPSVRVSIGEEVGLKPGSITDGKLVAALRALGFNYVFDTCFGADLTIMEEGTEFFNRLKTGGPLPLMTSCCPAWINTVEKLYPELIPNLSSCKSPMMMTGAVINTLFAKKIGIDREDIYTVAIMPCTAKKQEYRRKQMWRDGMRDVNAVLTTRELGVMIRESKVDFENLADSSYDSLMSKGTGAGAIFASSGGVTEALVRTAYELDTGKTLDKLDFLSARGMECVKTAAVQLTSGTIKIAVVHGIKHARALCDKIIKGQADFHVVEVMACPGGCIGGGGQPKSLDPQIIQKRMHSVYTFDRMCSIRKSHCNPDVQDIYKNFFEKPNSHKAHELLHTEYSSRKHKVVVTTEEDDDETDSITQQQLLILYATMTGTSEGVARRIAGDAALLNFNVRCVPINEYDFKTELQNEKLFVYVTSTFGMGEMPTPANDFWDWLQSEHSNDMLKDTQYSVFGLGSADYKENFNLAAKLVDQRLQELGAAPLSDVGCGDDRNVEKYEAAFDPWMEKLWSKLEVDLALLDQGVAPPQHHVVLTLGDSRRHPAPNCEFAKVSNYKLLTPPGYSATVYHIEFELPKKLNYATGYHMGIMPRNDDQRVVDFLKAYGLNASLPVCIIPNGNARPLAGMDNALTIKCIFKTYLDVFAPVTRSFMRLLAPFAEDEEEGKKLRFLGSLDGKEEFVKDYLDESACYADVLLKFASARPTLSHLVDMIPMIRPRLYSIASGSNMHPRHVQLTVGAVQWDTPSGQVRKGLCSNYLKELGEGAFGEGGSVENKDLRVSCFIKASPLCPPKDPSAPVIMVGLGTGIAPFRGFVQHIQHCADQGMKTGHAVLLFGCRRKADLVHEDEFATLEERGLLSFFPALSRETAKKVYVTDRIRENPKLVYDCLQRGSFFYCGPAGSVPKNVRDATIDAYAEGSEGTITREQAEKYIGELESQERFVMEAW